MCINCLNAQKVDVRVELTKKTSHCKSRDFLRKRRLKMSFIRTEDRDWLDISETHVARGKNFMKTF